MFKLGPHLRHNRQHTLFHVQEQPYSKFVFHIHDQQPMIYSIFTLVVMALKNASL
jgi:hypothetical protein